MNPIFDTHLQPPTSEFRFLERPLADGLRASTASKCGACAIIEYLDPTDERVANFMLPGVATMGHLLHQLWAHQSFQGVAHEVEAVIPWEHGVSHDDVLVLEGEHAGIYEVKTHSSTSPKAPSRENYAQAEYRLFLRELSGLPMPGPMRLVMIGKAGRETGMIRGPWTVTLTDERRAEIAQQLDLIDQIMQRADKVSLTSDPVLKELANGCTRCFPKPIVVADALTETLLADAEYLKQRLDEAEAERARYAAAKKQLKADYDELRAAVANRFPPEAKLEGRRMEATVSKAGVVTLRQRHQTAI